MMRLAGHVAHTLISALREVAGAVWEVNPFLAPRDLLNRWGTYRLRRHPFQILIRILGMGAMVWIIHYLGTKWIQPHLLRAAQGISVDPLVNELMVRTAGAIFSSLNIISCLSVAAIWNDLRHMARDGHLESLQVVPGRLSAPALYYAVATRYLPLALVALLIFFIEPRTSPFERFPFVDPGTPFVGDPLLPAQMNPQFDALTPPEKLNIIKGFVPEWEKVILDPWTIYWPFITIGGMLLFCIVNFWMDTAIGFWVFCRFRASIPSLIAAVMIVGGATPFCFMAINMIVRQRFDPILNTTPQSLDDILDTYYFLFSSAASLIVAVGLLTLTALQWRRLQTSSKDDPVLLRVHY